MTYKESSSKHHDKKSHINDLDKTLFEVFKKTDNSNDFIDDCSDIHQDSSNSVKQKFILRYKPSEQKESLTILVNEAKILFLRSRDPSTIAYDTLLKLIASGFSENSKMMFFFKMKLDSYFTDHRTHLNTEARVYAEDYINNN
ncbi:4440_t:CDS:2, partial [Funneliformis caledonium]